MAPKNVSPGLCHVCRKDLVGIDVSKNGQPPRHRVFQCPHHCEKNCPKCEYWLQAVIHDSNFKELICHRCGWTGQGLTDQQLKVWKKSRAGKETLNRLFQLRKQWRLYEPKAGAPCHLCGRPLREAFFEPKQLSAELFTWKRRIYCAEKACDFESVVTRSRKADTQEVLDFKRSEWKKKAPLTINCGSCGQIPNVNGNCGCS